MFRKSSITLVALLCTSAVSLAQVSMDMGLKVGITMANQSWDYTNFSIPNFDTRNGVDVAAFLELSTLLPVGVVLETHYIQKGFHTEFVVTTPQGPEPVGLADSKPRVDYLSIPLLAKVGLPMLLSPYILAGPRLDIKINSDGDSFDAVYDDLESYDFGGTVGLGIQPVYTPLIAIFAELRYSPSFRNVYDTDLLTVKNKSFEFLVGVKF